MLAWRGIGLAVPSSTGQDQSEWRYAVRTSERVCHDFKDCSLQVVNAGILQDT